MLVTTEANKQLNPRAGCSNLQLLKVNQGFYLAL